MLLKEGGHLCTPGLSLSVHSVPAPGLATPTLFQRHSCPPPQGLVCPAGVQGPVLIHLCGRSVAWLEQSRLVSVDN